MIEDIESSFAHRLQLIAVERSQIIESGIRHGGMGFIVFSLLTMSSSYFD